MATNTNKSFLYNNGLSIAFLILAVLAITGQALTGWYQYNIFLNDHHISAVSLVYYFRSGHFLQATFENWESELFQMALFVWLTVFLKQKGSSESKKMSGREEVDRQPQKHPAVPDLPLPTFRRIFVRCLLAV